MKPSNVVRARSAPSILARAPSPCANSATGRPRAANPLATLRDAKPLCRISRRPISWGVSNRKSEGQFRLAIGASRSSATVEFSVKLDHISGWGQRAPVPITPLIAQVQPFPRRTQKKREEQPLFIKPIQLARNLIAKVAAQDLPIGVSQKSVFLNRSRKDFVIEPYNEQSTEADPPSSHGIEHMHPGKILCPGGQSRPLQHSDNVVAPIRK